VVPLLQELSRILEKDRYVVCRKEIHGYMISPVKSKKPPLLVIDGADVEILSGKKVVIIDDVVSSGKTLEAVTKLVEQLGAQVVAKIAVFKQGNSQDKILQNLIYFAKLPVFPS